MRPDLRAVNVDLLVGVLDQAVDALLHARVLLGGVDDTDVPQDGLDAALTADEPLKRSRKVLDDLISRVRYVVGVQHEGLGLDLEAAASDDAARGVDVAYRVGVGRRIRRE